MAGLGKHAGQVASELNDVPTTRRNPGCLQTFAGKGLPASLNFTCFPRTNALATSYP